MYRLQGWISQYYLFFSDLQDNVKLIDAFYNSLEPEGQQRVAYGDFSTLHYFARCSRAVGLCWKQWLFSSFLNYYKLTKLMIQLSLLQKIRRAPRRIVSLEEYQLPVSRYCPENQMLLLFFRSKFLTCARKTTISRAGSLGNVVLMEWKYSRSRLS